MSERFTPENAAALDEGIAALLAGNDINHATLSNRAKESLRVVAHFAQQYGFDLLAGVRQQMIDQIDTVPLADRDGYRLAIRAVAETDFGEQHRWTTEGL